MQWTWTWENSRRWWWTGRPGVLQSIGSQRVRHDWATEMNWTELMPATGFVRDHESLAVDCWSYNVLHRLAFHLLFIRQSCPTLCDPIDCSKPGLPVPHHLLEMAQVHVHCIGDAIQPSHPLTPSSPSALDLSQRQRLFQWVVCSHQMTKILELQL